MGLPPRGSKLHIATAAVATSLGVPRDEGPRADNDPNAWEGPNVGKDGTSVVVTIPEWAVGEGIVPNPAGINGDRAMEAVLP